MDKILTLQQLQTMSTEELMNAYQNGYRLADNTEVQSLQIQSLNYTYSDLGIITAAILISTGLTSALVYYLIKREEKKILNDIKESVSSTVARVPSIIERLIPIAERVIAPRPE